MGINVVEEGRGRREEREAEDDSENEEASEGGEIAPASGYRVGIRQRRKMPTTAPMIRCAMYLRVNWVGGGLSREARFAIAQRIEGLARD